MNVWREPITDRTAADVKNADTGSLEYQKGTLNADDLNRIEDNYKYLMAKLRSDAIFIPHRLRNYTETVLEYVQTGTVEPEHTVVEYIEFTGTQYFDLGFKPNQDTRVTVDIDVIAQNEQSCLFGARTAYQNTCFGVFTSASNAGYQVDYGNTATDKVGGTSSGRHILDFDKNVFSVDDLTVHTATYTSFQCAYNLFLLSYNNAGSAMAAYPVSGKLYSCKIYDNAVLVRDLIPVLDANSVACLYDQLNSVYYYNAGTGTFTAGPEIEVETDPVYELVETQTTYTDWQENNLPWLSEINRIRANYNALVRLFLVGLGLPVLAESNYLDWQEVNDWEHIALVGKEMFENMEQEYRYCGMKESGGDRLL